MIKLFEIIRNKHSLIYKAFLTLISISLIVFALPKELKFKFEFEKGKPWLHEDLFAPFDFAVKKPQTLIEQEKLEIKLKSKPYLQYDTDAKDLVYQNFYESLLIYFQSNFEHELDRSPNLNELHQTGIALLNEVYNHGIVQQDEKLEQLNFDDLVVVIKNHVEENHEFQYYFTLQEAADQVQKFNTSAQSDELVRDIKNLVIENLIPNIKYDAELTNEVLENSLNKIPETYGKVAIDEKIIERGELVGESHFQKLQSLKQEYENKIGGSNSFWYVFTGQILLVCIMIASFITYLAFFRKDFINETHKFTFLLVVFTVTIVLAALVIQIPDVSVYLIPYCLLPIIIKTFFDSRLAAFIHVMAMILIGLFAPNGFEFVFVQIVTGLAALYSLESLRRRAQLFNTVIIIFLSYSLNYIGFFLIQEGSFDDLDLLKGAWFGGNAILTLLAYPLIFVFEKTFGLISDVTLLELSDTNNKLLRQLAEKAPGTFQHSLQVANLAEEAAILVGGDALLIRTGALYHDIGKMKNPVFFIENQASVNPHDKLDYPASASIIINHVIEGIELAKKENIPDQVIDFIRTHHGTSVTGYFYNMAKKSKPDISINQFVYPGPKPFSLETAILMMADSVEAASRSLKEYNADTIGNLVDGIIQSQMDSGQFNNASITFKDISAIKKTFKRKLSNIYHVRIEYPK